MRNKCRALRPACIILILLLNAAIMAACASTVSNDWQAQLSTCPTSVELGKFMPWDRLEIRVFGQDDLSGEYEVSPRGTISFPMLGEISVEGKRCDELEVIIREGLQAEYLRDPSVICINREVSKTAVTVDGQVQKPGIVDFRPGLMLTDVIAQSGGPTVRAQTNAVVIVRKTEGASKSVSVPYQDILLGNAPNVCLHPADLVYVPQSVF
ncbi:MAG: polysaccharide biosynthesis/export family protein [Proteobacteria bacterium]|nr:polysaccharide biosynthesis/export family protein [Pseudomonadota bacterium]